MSSVFENYLFTIVGNFILFNIFYLWATIKRDYSVIDIAWGIGFVTGITLHLYQTYSPVVLPPRVTIISLLIILWGLRLSLFLVYRKYYHSQEDWRYQLIRKGHGKYSALKAYFSIFLLQFLIQLILIIPLIETLKSSPSELSSIDFIGFFITLLAIFYESVADWQKFTFKQKNPLLPITSGLWKYSQHANYFGEILVWTGFCIFSITSGVLHIGIMGPILICFLLLKVSGVPFLKNKNSSNPKYLKYYAETNLLIPWFPKINKELEND